MLACVPGVLPVCDCSFEGLADRFPTEREWRAMDDAADRTAQDPAGDPASFSQRELLRSDALLGAETVDVDRELKSEMPVLLAKGGPGGADGRQADVAVGRPIHNVSHAYTAHSCLGENPRP